VPPRRLDGIEQKLQSLHAKGNITHFAEDDKDEEIVEGLLGELNDALRDYQVRHHRRASAIYSRQFS
jgi:hypothetical protein